jgi:hypothetical protein
MPEYIVTVKKEHERASNALGETDNLPRIQLTGNTIHKKIGTTYRQATQVSKIIERVNYGTHESGIKRSRLQHKVGATKNHRT